MTANSAWIVKSSLKLVWNYVTRIRSTQSGHKNAIKTVSSGLFLRLSVFRIYRWKKIGNSDSFEKLFFFLSEEKLRISTYVRTWFQSASSNATMWAESQGSIITTLDDFWIFFKFRKHKDYDSKWMGKCRDDRIKCCLKRGDYLKHIIQFIYHAHRFNAHQKPD